MVSESRVTWATSIPILVVLGLSVLDLGPMYATDRDRQTSDRRQAASSLNVPPRWRGHNNQDHHRSLLYVTDAERSLSAMLVDRHNNTPVLFDYLQKLIPTPSLHSRQSYHIIV